ncbi:FAD dependent oxidoreductase [Venustampulla echinocandica]|uniref:FAD dependent oxidoreductase n=1 Tax=Venustampulla echinocandica TaxID=2656787 RepID=A0A370TCV4_9HELO|nr:FAD dependent oxidoreductase [Venustampulla echinocandica]RDL32065.1 FAD dependent oxidoreductase [Venustampulla echinocandica]
MSSTIAKPCPSSLLPVKDSTTPFWRTQLHELDDHQSTPDLPSLCDILIIGGGYAGIAASYHLLAGEDSNLETSKPSVVLLEAREACSGATARNGGHLRPAVYAHLSSYIKEYGVEAASELAEFELSHVKAIADLVEKEKIECDFTLTKSFDVFTDNDMAEEIKEAYFELKAAGIAKTTMDDLVWTEGEDAEKVSGVKGCVGCFSFTAAHLWPYKLMMALLSRSVAHGLNLQTHTPVTGISRSSSGTWTAITPRGSITARQVIIATNGYVSARLPEYSGKIVPCRGICSRIVVPPFTQHPHIDKTYGLRFPGGSHDYLIPRSDGSLIVSGARSKFITDQSTWYNVVDDSSLIESASNYFDNYMQDHFLGWEENGAYVERIWTGIMGFNDDKIPSVGEVPGREGCFIAAGFEGHGMPVIWLVMRGVVSLLNGKRFEDVGIPRIYKTTKERLDSTTQVGQVSTTS